MMRSHDLAPAGARLLELDATASAAIRGGGIPAAIVAAVTVAAGWLIKNWKDVEEGYQSVCN